MQVEEKVSSDDDSKENETEVTLPERPPSSSEIQRAEPQQEGSRRNSDTIVPLTINCDTQPQKMDIIPLQ